MIASAILLIGIPVFLKVITAEGASWRQLSDASQVYSSLASALALIGVAGSLLYQARQSGIAAHELLRANQRELFVFAVQNPDLLPCYAPPNPPISEQSFKQIGFVNLILSGLYSSYELGMLSDSGLKHALLSHFRGEIAQQHWEARGTYWTEAAENSGSRVEKRFVKIANEAYRESIAEGPPVAPSQYYSADR
ncbi:DUF6082 family protein [Streptomyces sp. NPDC057621]|uniref:DUF6082 family protein n=1 Tax=Streptomyces sp. NPDC057621 TaxID=3346186 RepID=UPI00369C78A0